MIRDPAYTCQQIKVEASYARLWWMEEKDPSTLPAGLITSFMKEFPRLDVWSSLGRALPAKPGYMVEQDVREKHEDFFRDPVIPTSSIPDEAGEFLRRCLEKGKPMKGIPFSDSAALCFSRNSGGQANFLREVIALCRKTSGISPWGDPPPPTDTAGVRRWYEEMFLYLDKPFLDHLSQCPGLECTQAHLHFPCQLTGIPEGGFRTRIPTVPWISLVFMTKALQVQLSSGLFRDPRFSGGQPWGKKRVPGELLKGDGLIISSDWKTGTDALSVEASCRAIAYVGADNPHAMASMGHMRLIDPDEEVPQWPGLQALLKMLPVYREHLDSSVSWVSEVMRKYRDKVSDFSLLVEEPENIFNAVRPGGPIGATYKGFVTPSGRQLRKALVGISSGVRRDTGTFVPGHDVLTPEILRELFSSMVSWYRGAVMCSPGKLHRRGQHMSLPLSWVLMSAFHEAMARPLPIFFGWGDDAIGRGTPEQIAEYKSRGESIGVIFHSTSKSFEVPHRGVFLEDLIDRGRWHYVSKARFSCRGDDESPEEGAWMSAFISPTQWSVDEDIGILKEARESFYWKSIEDAVKFGLDPTIPTFMGGLGRPGRGRTGLLNFLPHKEYDRICGQIRSMLGCTSLDELSVPNPIYALDLDYLEKSRPEGDSEMWLKYFKPAYVNRETQGYRFIMPPKRRTVMLGPENVGFRCGRLLRSIGFEGVARYRDLIVRGSAVKDIKPEAQFWLRA